MYKRPRPLEALRCRVAISLSSLLLFASCTPELNWRDVKADGSVALQFPCRPDALERDVTLAGEPVRLALLRCDAGGSSWAFTQGDVREPGRVAPALQALRQAALANVDATASAPLLLKLPQANGLLIQGKLPDGRPVQMQVAWFAHGTRVYQATAHGPQVAQDAAGVFFDSLRVGP